VRDGGWHQRSPGPAAGERISDISVIRPGGTRPITKAIIGHVINRNDQALQPRFAADLI